jgi:hypothetical protein
MPAHDPNVWTGGALQEGSVRLESSVSHQCIRPLSGAELLLAIMDVSARSILLADKPQGGYWGHQFSINRSTGYPHLPRSSALSASANCCIRNANPVARMRGLKWRTPNSFRRAGSEAGLVRGSIIGADASGMTRAPKSWPGAQ